MTYCCKTDGAAIVISDARAGGFRCVVRSVEWGVWTATDVGPALVSLCWSKCASAFDAAVTCRVARVCFPSRRLVFEGGPAQGGGVAARPFPIGAQLCELYIHARANGLVVGLTILPVADGVWWRPRPPCELRGKTSDDARGEVAAAQQGATMPPR